MVVDGEPHACTTDAQHSRAAAGRREQKHPQCQDLGHTAFLTTVPVKADFAILTGAFPGVFSGQAVCSLGIRMQCYLSRMNSCSVRPQ